MNIHDRARQLAGQMQVTVSEAYSILSRRSAESRRRRAQFGVIKLQRRDTAWSHVEPAKIRLPYADD